MSSSIAVCAKTLKINANHFYLVKRVIVIQLIDSPPLSFVADIKVLIAFCGGDGTISLIGSVRLRFPHMRERRIL